MTFTRRTYAGASLRSFNASIGWNGQRGQLGAQLVEDAANGDAFVAPTVGQPGYFSFGDFAYFGLVQAWKKLWGGDGLPLYEVVLVDPADVLETATVLVGGYDDSVGGVRNVLNAYGFWEGQSFGLSLVNEAGMLWSRVQAAILAMVNSSSQGTYGGPLVYRGVSYGLDLSELPQPPADYRIGGVAAGLLEIIQAICEDGGHDFFLELDGLRVKVRTVSRRNQPPLGTMSSLVELNLGNTVVRAQTGVEARNETTAAFLVGGEVQTVFQSSFDEVYQFWGHDVNGVPILGSSGNLDLYDASDPPVLLSSLPTDYAQLNCSSVADIIGHTSYRCSTHEMRLAQANANSWQMFILAHRRDIANRIGLTSPFAMMGGAGGGVLNRNNFLNDGPANVRGLGRVAAIQQSVHHRAQRVYEFVKNQANEYYGRKFLVSLPFIETRTDPETLHVSTSWEISDGGYLEDGASPLGLAQENEDLLKTPDGRFKTFVKYTDVASGDLGTIPIHASVIEDQSLYLEASVDRSLAYDPFPAAILDVRGAVRHQAADGTGDLSIIWAIVQGGDEAEVRQAMQNAAAGNMGVRIAPSVLMPSRAAVALKSNVSTYGPWYAEGAQGKVKVEHDPSLVPWNFGSYDALDDAGAARVAQAVTSMTTSEGGLIEFAGPPTKSLGAILKSNGPNLTNINVAFGTQGVTTTYAFSSYTPRFGVFGKAYQERLKRLALSNLEVKKATRAAQREAQAKAEVQAGAARADWAFMNLAPPHIRRESPHPVAIAHALPGPSGTVRTSVSLATAEEALTTFDPDDAEWHVRTAAMGLEGLLRPYSTKPGGETYMGGFAAPSISGVVPTCATLSPWKASHDVELATYGDEYEGFNQYLRGAEPDNTRALGLKGPIVVTGWGFAFDGSCVPSGGAGTEWADDWLRKPQDWKTGPMDPLWDERRGVWSCHGRVRGRLLAPLASGSSASMEVAVGSGSPFNMTVYNHYNTAVSGQLKVMASYDPYSNKWYVDSADCS
jgi:hypothetical protein